MSGTTSGAFETYSRPDATPAIWIRVHWRPFALRIFFLKTRQRRDQIPKVDLDQLASLLTGMGCPPEKSKEMASQLDKRARQLAEKKGRTYEDALTYLLDLMQRGWAAKESGQ